MIIRYLSFLLIAAIFLFSGCAKRKDMTLSSPPALSSLQRAAMQTKEFDCDFDIAFSSTISVLQDEGWQITVVDRQSGVIQAGSLKRQDIIGPFEDWIADKDKDYRNKIVEKTEKGKKPQTWTRWEQLTSHIEPWGKNSVKQRITITKYGSLPSYTYTAGKKKSGVIETEGGKDQSLIIDNPAVYQYLFQQIQRAIFIRQGLEGKK